MEEVNNTVSRSRSKNCLKQSSNCTLGHGLGFPRVEGHAFACFVIDDCAWD
jgi:hypothetical protein